MSISFSKTSGTSKKDESPDPHSLPLMTSNTMAVAIVCMYINNSQPYIYTCSPGLTLESLGHTSISSSHDVSLVPHKFTNPKPSSSPSSPNQLHSQTFSSAKDTVTHPSCSSQKPGCHSFHSNIKSTSNPSTSLHLYFH